MAKPKFWCKGMFAAPPEEEKGRMSAQPSFLVWLLMIPAALPFPVVILLGLLLVCIGMGVWLWW